MKSVDYTNFVREFSSLSNVLVRIVENQERLIELFETKSGAITKRVPDGYWACKNCGNKVNENIYSDCWKCKTRR